VETRPRTLLNYLTVDNHDPFDSWLRKLRDGKARAIIRTRLNRVMQGNFGDVNSVGEGVHKLVVGFGSGYRVYFGEDGDDVILLGGGDKSTQAADIKKAKDRWSDYNA
jgi:putative addiction module killer protein